MATPDIINATDAQQPDTEAAAAWLRELDVKVKPNAAALQQENAGNAPRGLGVEPVEVAPVWEDVRDRQSNGRFVVVSSPGMSDDDDDGDDDDEDEEAGEAARVQFVGRYFLRHQGSIDAEILNMHQHDAGNVDDVDDDVDIAEEEDTADGSSSSVKTRLQVLERIISHIS